MKNYPKEELLIEIRRREANKRPEPGELIQGVVFASINAQEFFESSSILFSKGKPVPAYGLFIHGIEELGKIAYLADVLISWQSPEKSSHYKNKQKDHSWKISGALRMLSRFFDMKSVSVQFNGKIKSTLGELEGDEIIKYFKASLNPSLASRYHEQRLNGTYTGFDGKRVSSPKNGLVGFSSSNCEYAATLASDVLKKLLEICDEKLPIYMMPIRKAYEGNNPKEINAAKKEINRRVIRTMPAVRKYMDDLYKIETGFGIDELIGIYRTELPNILEGKGNIMEHISRLAELIKSHEKIEDYYWYPPLKEDAKEYYMSLINSSELLQELQLKRNPKRKTKKGNKKNA